MIRGGALKSYAAKIAFFITLTALPLFNRKCGAMIFGLGVENWSRLLAWLAIGLVIYFVYSRKHAKIKG